MSRCNRRIRKTTDNEVYCTAYECLTKKTDLVGQAPTHRLLSQTESIIYRIHIVNFMSEHVIFDQLAHEYQFTHTVRREKGVSNMTYKIVVSISCTITNFYENISQKWLAFTIKGNKLSLQFYVTITVISIYLYHVFITVISVPFCVLLFHLVTLMLLASLRIRPYLSVPVTSIPTLCSFIPSHYVSHETLAVPVTSVSTLCSFFPSRYVTHETLAVPVIYVNNIVYKENSTLLVCRW